MYTFTVQTALAMTVAVVSSCDLELSPVTPTFGLDLDKVKVNQHANDHFFQKLLSADTQTDSHGGPIAIPGPLEWSVGNSVACPSVPDCRRCSRRSTREVPGAVVERR